MSKVLCEKSDLVAIADSVRSKTGTTGGMKVSEISQKIEAIETGGNINLQEKAVTITSNGTITITPDAPYDALKKVSVQTNIDPYDPKMAETVTCLSTSCTIHGVFLMSGNDGNKVIAPYVYTTSGTAGAKILKGSHITFQSTLGGFPIYWTPSDALSVVSNAIYYPSGTKDGGFYVCKVVKDFQLLLDD